MNDQSAAGGPGKKASAPDACGTASFPGLSRIEPLGRGSMGTVFRAWQDDLTRPWGGLPEGEMALLKG